MTDRTDSRQRPPAAAATLAATLGLRPLDRLQLVSRRAIAETTLLPAGMRRPDLPFYYFQRVVGEMLEVRSRLALCGERVQQWSAPPIKPAYGGHPHL